MNPEMKLIVILFSVLRKTSFVGATPMTPPQNYMDFAWQISKTPNTALLNRMWRNAEIQPLPVFQRMQGIDLCQELLGAYVVHCGETTIAASQIQQTLDAVSSCTLNWDDDAEMEIQGAYNQSMIEIEDDIKTRAIELEQMRRNTQVHIGA